MRTSKKVLAVACGAAMLSGCISTQYPPDRNPQAGRPTQQADAGDRCSIGEKVYRPSPKSKARPEDTIPPDYDAPSQLPYSCKTVKY
ncbi:MAG TPA: hypothetical protein VG942_16400 [Hyphomonadaceae bacterium]|nr:hypothetical protein [Hyphomonadaceae bacterium]